QEQENDRISNLYNIQFVNKTFDPMPLRVEVAGVEGATIRRVGEEALVLPPGQMQEGVFFVELPRASLAGMKTPLEIRVLRGDEVVEEAKTNFMGPAGG
ncbi:MAG: FixG Ig-like domain-containing protein, partial [Catalinimonas sp.]